jgi:hypothetical protein
MAILSPFLERLPTDAATREAQLPDPQSRALPEPEPEPEPAASRLQPEAEAPRRHVWHQLLPEAVPPPSEGYQFITLDHLDDILAHLVKEMTGKELARQQQEGGLYSALSQLEADVSPTEIQTIDVTAGGRKENREGPTGQAPGLVVDEGVPEIEGTRLKLLPDVASGGHAEPDQTAAAAAAAVQRYWRGHCGRRETARTRSELLDSVARITRELARRDGAAAVLSLAGQEMHGRHCAATLIATRWRGWAARVEWLEQSVNRLQMVVSRNQGAAVCVQRLERGRACRQRLRRELAASLVLQRLCRVSAQATRNIRAYEA